MILYHIVFKKASPFFNFLEKIFIIVFLLEFVIQRTFYCLVYHLCGLFFYFGITELIKEIFYSVEKLKDM